MVPCWPVLSAARASHGMGVKPQKFASQPVGLGSEKKAEADEANE